MMRLYNPHNGAEFTTASDDEDHVSVYLQAGWKPAPEPKARPGFAPEPVTYAKGEDDLYAPVEDEPEPEPKPKRSTRAKEESAN